MHEILINQPWRLFDISVAFMGWGRGRGRTSPNCFLNICFNPVDPFIPRASSTDQVISLICLDVLQKSRTVRWQIHGQSATTKESSRATTSNRSLRVEHVLRDAHRWDPSVYIHLSQRKRTACCDLNQDFPGPCHLAHQISQDTTRDSAFVTKVLLMLPTLSGNLLKLAHTLLAWALKSSNSERKDPWE